MSLRVNRWELHVDGQWLHARIAHRTMDWGRKIACGLALGHEAAATRLGEWRYRGAVLTLESQGSLFMAELSTSKTNFVDPLVDM